LIANRIPLASFSYAAGILFELGIEALATVAAAMDVGVTLRAYDKRVFILDCISFSVDSNTTNHNLIQINVYTHSGKPSNTHQW